MLADVRTRYDFAQEVITEANKQKLGKRVNKKEYFGKEAAAEEAQSSLPAGEDIGIRPFSWRGEKPVSFPFTVRRPIGTRSKGSKSQQRLCSVLQAESRRYVPVGRSDVRFQ